jgi:hypothetical protein
METIATVSTLEEEEDCNKSYKSMMKIPSLSPQDTMEEQEVEAQLVLRQYQ